MNPDASKHEELTKKKVFIKKNKRSRRGGGKNLLKLDDNHQGERDLCLDIHLTGYMTHVAPSSWDIPPTAVHIAALPTGDKTSICAILKQTSHRWSVTLFSRQTSLCTMSVLSTSMSFQPFDSVSECLEQSYRLMYFLPASELLVKSICAVWTHNSRLLKKEWLAKCCGCCLSAFPHKYVHELLTNHTTLL